MISIHSPSTLHLTSLHPLIWPLSTYTQSDLSPSSHLTSLHLHSIWPLSIHSSDLSPPTQSHQMIIFHLRYLSTAKLVVISTMWPHSIHMHSDLNPSTRTLNSLHLHALWPHSIYMHSDLTPSTRTLTSLHPLALWPHSIHSIWPKSK